VKRLASRTLVPAAALNLARLHDVPDDRISVDTVVQPVLIPLATDAAVRLGLVGVHDRRPDTSGTDRTGSAGLVEVTVEQGMFWARGRQALDLAREVAADRLSTVVESADEVPAPFDEFRVAVLQRVLQNAAIVVDRLVYHLVTVPTYLHDVRMSCRRAGPVLVTGPGRVTVSLDDRSPS